VSPTGFRKFCFDCVLFQHFPHFASLAF
jgi:hypothetical protein